MARWRASVGVIGATLAAISLAPASTAATTEARRITFVGVVADHPNLRPLEVGGEGSWFPQFDAGTAIDGAPTGDHALDRLPRWIGALNHTTGPADPGCTAPTDLVRGCLPTYAFRSFSQDGPARSASHPTWATLRLPDGERGRAGAIVDPHTSIDGEPNRNNTVNRLQLQGDVPTTFYVSVLVDQAADRAPAEVEVRGNAGTVDDPTGSAQVEPDRAATLEANGRPDLVVFEVSGFAAGDYLKVRLRGTADHPASFAGLLFDTAQPRGAASRSTSHTTRSAATREAGTSTPS